MKIIPCVMLLFFYTLPASAQQNARPVLPFIDSSGSGVLKVSPPGLTYKSTNNHFDIYSATPYNIHVIKPDSTIHFKNANRQV